MAVKFQIEKSPIVAFCFNFLLPGLGHIHWGEYLFGVFIFLIMLLAVALFLVSFLISLPAFAYWILFGLPVLFFAFSFVDLARTIRQRKSEYSPSRGKCLIFIIGVLIFQVFTPGAPINFSIINAPSIHTVPHNDFSPVFREGDVVRLSRMAYTVDLPFFKQPVTFAAPERYDVIGFADSSGVLRLGAVIGLPGEEIQVVEGLIVANGIPVAEGQYTELVLTGDCALTLVEQYSILVATVRLGRIEAVHIVPLTEVKGKIKPLL